MTARNALATDPPYPVEQTISAANLLSQSNRFLLDKEVAARLLDDMQKQIRSTWRNTARRAGVSETDCEKISGAFVYEGFFYD